MGQAQVAAWPTGGENGCVDMISLLFLLVFFAAATFVFLRRPAVAAAAFFLLFPLVYRAVDIVYLDMVGPVFASELGRYVGGNDAAPMFIYAGLCLVMPLIWAFRETGGPLLQVRSRAAWQGYHHVVSNVALVAISGLVILLFLNMLRTGTVPLLQGIDRIEYNQMAGAFHNAAYELNFLVSFSLGAFTVLPRLNGKDYDLRFSAVFAALFFLWVLTGNRFSVFFSQFSFYFMPLAAIIIARKAGLISALGPNSVLQRVLASRVVRFFGMVFAIVCLAGLVINSYYNVRNYRDPIQQMEERILVQPVQLWAVTWERVDFGKLHASLDRHAVDQIIVNPIDATRNTTIQYLITLQLGYFRSAEIARMGQQYNGGYPEVYFELFNPWIAVLLMPIIGLLTALVLRLCIVLLYRNMVISAIAAVYVYFGFCLHYAGGSVTFFLTPSYWVKIVILIVAVMWEQQFTKRRPYAAYASGRTPGYQALGEPAASSRP